jgi:maleate isomerase
MIPTPHPKHISYGERGRLGMLLPSGNQVAEPLFNLLLPQGVSLYTTRLKLTGSSEAQLLAMIEKIEEAAELVADAGATLVLFHCTAVSTFNLAWEKSIKDRIMAATGKPAITTSECLVAALRAVNAQRLVMLSPYTAAVNERETRFFETHGFEILANWGMDQSTADGMMAVTPSTWEKFAVTHRDDRADAYVFSCTTARSVEAVEAVERALGKPVITSNSAALWYASRSMGVADLIAGCGTLLRL